MARFIIRFALLATWVAMLSSCAQSVDDVNIQSRQPIDNPILPFNYIATMGIQGGSSVTVTSPNRAMSIQAFGGNGVRTYSTSSSFIMTSGIGID